MAEIHPLIILAAGVITVLGLIIYFRFNAFIALISAAIVVSLLAPGDMAEKISRVAEAFGTTAGKIGIVIAMAAVIGRCLIDSGAADRIVRSFIRLLGEKRCSLSLMTSGFVLSIPVFFDTVFYLLLPLARSMHRQTKKSFVLLVLAMGAGASITHSLVPPTPGPLIIAETLGIDIGMMISVGLLVAVPTAVIILFFIGWLSRKMDIPMRPLEGSVEEPQPLPDEKLPGLFASMLPIVLPVLMITSNTIVSTLVKKSPDNESLQNVLQLTSLIGNANLAMLVAGAVAIYVFWRQRKPSRQQLSRLIENALMSGGIIILITSAGGAFGAMLKTAEIGPAIQNMFVTKSAEPVGGMGLLFIGFFIAFLIKFAQGSSTVSMITTSAMLASLITSTESIGYHPVYLATAIGFGAQCGNWMNDSGFWIFAKMSGFTEVETLKTWTVTVSTLALIGFGVTLILATFLPLS